MNAPELLNALHLAERLKDATRHCYTSGGRHESVAEHSWRLALMAFFLRDAFPEADMDRVVRMCLIHDLGEAFTGDIPTFKKTEADERREETLLDAWVASLPSPYREEMAALYRDLGEEPPPGLKGDFCAVLAQPHMAEADIDFADTARLTAGDILRHLNERLAPHGIVLAPEHASSYAFGNNLVTVSDAVPGNVVVARNGRAPTKRGGIVVLDADFELKGDVFRRFHAPEPGMRA